METTIIVSELDGKEYIQIERQDGSFEVMTKARWDELEGQKEAGLGGTL